MKIRFLIIYALLAFSTFSANSETVISCIHPELCRLAETVGQEAGLKNMTYKTLVKISGDPHEFELSMSDVKNLINAPILILGPSELNPWAKKVDDQRSKNKSLKTISLTLPKLASELYPGGSREALSHFWLYPKIYCQIKHELTVKMLKQALITKILNEDACNKNAALVENKLQITFAKITAPIILTHDAIEPLNEFSVVVIPIVIPSVISVSG